MQPMADRRASNLLSRLMRTLCLQVATLYTYSVSMVDTVTCKRGKKQANKRRIRFPGITQAARDLGVTRTHLYYVLTGDRKSPTLLKQWRRWRADNA